MKSYFVIDKIMDKKIGVLGSVAAAVTLSVSPLSAEASNVKQACKTSLECAKLSNSLQAQISKLEKKGLGELTENEFIKYADLTERIIIAKDSTISIENDKQEVQEDAIASKDADLEEEREETKREKAKTQKAYSEVNANLSSIKGSLL